MVLLPGDDLGLLPLPIWHVLSLPAGLLAEGDQSDQGLGVAQSLMGLLPCPLVEMSIPNLEIRISRPTGPKVRGLQAQIPQGGHWEQH